ncbi:hypothetical protein [Halococcus salifodinae]|uniref:DUF8048 domain-containing protein n=2 Tax=Halococcus TaxID=2249 RepID=M0N5A6_9EURY|nr:hypothetical protein [Halococcus salifodinae]EMA52738.1 hypothetical protein C450_09733 [Halococcus salifodinae DSM 8989]
MTDDRSNDGSTADTRTTDGGTDEAAETPIEADVVDDVAEAENVPREGLVGALVVLNASLLGSHSTYEREYEYVTVDGVRGYVVDAGAWETLREEHDLDSRLATAAQHAHTEQTERLLAAADDDRATDDIDAGIVVGIDTAEVMN